MSTTMLPARPTTAGPDRAGRGRFARVLLALEIGLCVSAAVGASYLVAVPHDAMPASLLARTPFATWVIPGVLLALCVAVPAGVVAFGTATGRAYAHVGHPLLGLVLNGWIIAQLVVIGPSSALQPVMFAWASVVLVLGAVKWARPDSTWSWQLRPTATGGTRLVTRVRARYTGPQALLGVPLMEIGDFPMMRRCLLGLKARAERPSRPAVEPFGGSS